jgi:hypothetical protein
MNGGSSGYTFAPFFIQGRTVAFRPKVLQNYD